MIGRTLAEEEIAATGNRSRFSDARQVLSSRPPLKKKQWLHQPLSALAGYPQTSGFLAIPPSRFVFDRRASLVFFFLDFLCGDKVVSHLFIRTL